MSNMRDAIEILRSLTIEERIGVVAQCFNTETHTFSRHIRLTAKIPLPKREEASDGARLPTESEVMTLIDQLMPDEPPRKRKKHRRRASAKGTQKRS